MVAESKKRLLFSSNIRFALYSFCLVAVMILVFFAIVLRVNTELLSEPVAVIEEKSPFVVSVDPTLGAIVQATDEVILSDDVDIIIERRQKDSFWGTVVYQIAQSPIVQSVASPLVRVVVIWPGDRKEEVGESFKSVLGWSQEDTTLFITSVTEAEPYLQEGTFAPGKYIFPIDSTPEDAAEIVKERFRQDVLDRYTSDVAAQVPLEDALIIASLLEREAYDFNDMREISGVIWNRLFIDMKLQLDATLQYAKGDASRWWQVPVPDDKYLDSPFNTYQNSGLPPNAIANPSVSAIIAALNPNQTDCLFYFHYRNVLYCSADYEGHVSKLRSIYGRGS